MSSQKCPTAAPLTIMCLQQYVRGLQARRSGSLLCYATPVLSYSLKPDCQILQGMLEDLHGNTTAFGLSAAAAKTLRDTAQEDFETFEASEVDKSHDKDNKTPDEGDFSGEDDHMEE